MRALLPFFIRYCLIGSLCACIDIGSFHLFDRSGMALALSTGLSIFLATTVHFTLNKVWNFKSFDKSLARQLSIYLLVAGLCYVVALCVIEACSTYLGIPHDWGKVISIAVNIPVGFVGHKFFTFAPARVVEASS